jgi:hypothetical protein
VSSETRHQREEAEVAESGRAVDGCWERVLSAGRRTAVGAMGGASGTSGAKGVSLVGSWGTGLGQASVGRLSNRLTRQIL